MRAVLALVLLLATFPSASAQVPDLPLEPYHNAVTLYRDLEALVAEHPDLARFGPETRTLGQGRIVVVEVASPLADDPFADPRPTLVVDAGHHGNEILAVEAAYYFLETLLADASADPSILEGKRVVVVPVVNPDGFTRDTRLNGAAVDLNRNYPWRWGERGTAPNPGSLNYAGPSAASEAETQAMMDLFDLYGVDASVSFHTGTFDVVLPWDPENDTAIPDWTLYERVLGEIEDLTGMGYRAASGTGESIAHVYGNLGAFAILPEVSVEQNQPVTLAEAEESVAAGITIARLAFDRLHDLRGRLVQVAYAEGVVTVRNDGWGTAWSATADDASFADIAPGEEARLPVGECARLSYAPMGNAPVVDAGWLATRDAFAADPARRVSEAVAGAPSASTCFTLPVGGLLGTLVAVVGVALARRALRQ